MIPLDTAVAHRAHLTLVRFTRRNSCIARRTERIGGSEHRGIEPSNGIERST